MTDNKNANDATGVANQALIDEVVAKESGARSPHGATRWLIINTAVVWSLFQLWISSPVPFWVSAAVPPLQRFVMFNDTMARSIHLTFAVFLVYLCYPLWRSASKTRVPAYDWLLAAIAAFCASYIFTFHAGLSQRPGTPTALDIWVSVAGVLTLLEATRRCLGLPMTIMAIVFLAYVFGGPYMPDMIAHKGASLSRAASHMWLTTEGVFGVALGVSTSFVFLYVLFGAMLDQAGAGNYLTRVAFALMGHMRGGPAKASVLSSGLNGLISGSSVANVLTGGNVTIMLMKRVGYSPVKAGAIEVAASSNGQIMPPVMGAAAFLMVEYINMPYTEIIKHAFLPAILAYLSLFYIVHLEALKAGMRGLPRRISPLKGRLLGWGFTIAGTIIIVWIALQLTRWLPSVFGEASSLVVGALLLAVYVGTVWLSTRYPGDPGAEISPESMQRLPETKPTVLAGLFYILPLFVLVWCLMVLEQSPGLAAFYACTFMAVMLVTQRPLLAYFHRRSLQGTVRRGVHDLYRSLELGGRNMIGIAIATATAGIIVGTVSLTGIGQVLASVVEELSMGSLMGVLILTALLSLLLGMGLPTTANYIVVATLLAPVIVSLAASHGLEVPLIAVHLFVFYFGIMADATPPVALAAYAAAGLSGADPLKTGIQGFFYEMRTAILPFVFVFNTELSVDRHRLAAAPRVDRRHLDHRVLQFRGSHATPFSRAQPLVGDHRAAVRRVHAVSSRHLSRRVLSAVLGAAGRADAINDRRATAGTEHAAAHRGEREDRARGGTRRAHVHPAGDQRVGRRSACARGAGDATGRGRVRHRRHRRGKPGGEGATGCGELESIAGHRGPEPATGQGVVHVTGVDRAGAGGMGAAQAGRDAHSVGRGWFRQSDECEQSHS